MIQNLDPLEKLRIYMHYYIQTYYWNKEYGAKAVSFEEWTSENNVKVHDHGPHWEKFGFAQRHITNEYGIYYWYFRFKDEDFTHKPAPPREIKKIVKEFKQQNANTKENMRPELIGRSYTIYRGHYNDTSKMIARDCRKGDEVIISLNVSYIIHRKRFWWIKYYGLRIKWALARILKA